MSLSNPVSTFGAAGGTGTVAVSVARECSWSATSQASWVELTGTLNGQGDGSVAYRVAANVDPIARRGAITIADQHADVAQEAAPCQYDVSGPSTPLAASGGSASVDLRTHPACPWTAASNEDWASVAPASGTGPAAIMVTAQPNGGAARDVTLTLGSQHLTLEQSAAPDPAPTTPDPVPPSPTPTPTPTPPPTPEPTPAPTPTPTTVDVSGKISQLSGTCPSVEFVVSDRRVQTSPSTQFNGGSCNDLKNKMSVAVHGAALDAGIIAAQTVTLNR